MLLELAMSLTLDPKSWSVPPCPKVRQHWKIGEIKANDFQDIEKCIFSML